MKADEVRRKYLDFFKSSPRNHKEIPPSPLVLEGGSSTLFTSAGMQPLVPYLLGEPHPDGKRLVNSQPSIRLQDIDEVGDSSHTTFFEMLGNWSLGDYFKEEQLHWIWEFFTKELKLNKDKLWITLFEGDKQIPKDEKSAEIWEKIGIPEAKIFYCGAKKNWWSMTGTPEEMQVGHIGGPDSEVFYDFGEETGIHEKSPYKNEKCQPNCECGRFLEIGNSVFIQYKKVSDDKLEELPNKNVDFGGGLERITAAVNNTPDIFSIDVFKEIIGSIEQKFDAKYGKDAKKDRSMRIIADHMRAAYVLISSGVLPGNKEHEYVLRKLIRRAMLHARFLSVTDDFTPPEVNFSNFKISVELKSQTEINAVINEEANKFQKTVEQGVAALKRIFNKAIGGVDPENLSAGMKIENNIIRVDGREVFKIYETYGLPPEISQELMSGWGLRFDEQTMKECEEARIKHKELSRTTSAGVFKGGLADTSPEVIKLHTATHLLLASLRKVLGEHVVQRGQNITKERARFDFPNPEKLTEKQLKEVEDMINDIIAKDLSVNFKVMPKDEALKTGAIHAFNEKYADTVKVYYVGEDLERAFSKEFCGGPHVKDTREIGHVRIKKQEKIGAGLMRIYATLV